MFATRRTGPVYTSVQTRPGCLLAWAAFLLSCAIFLMAAWDIKVWALPLSILFALLGWRLARIAIRQMRRGIRTFFS
jgi:hypothetical protein